MKNASGIVGLVAQYVDLSASAPPSLKGLCPFHEEKTPSFNVHPAQGTYYCFGCNASGDENDFLKAITTSTYQKL